MSDLDTKSYLDNFTSVLSRRIDQAYEQTNAQIKTLTEETQRNRNDIVKLEVMLQNMMKVADRCLVAVEKASDTVNEIAIAQANMSNKHQQLDYEAMERKEEIKAIYSKMDAWQSECSKKYSDMDKRVSKIHIVATTLAGVVSVLGTIAVSLIKVLV